MFGFLLLVTGLGLIKIEFQGNTYIKEGAYQSNSTLDDVEIAHGFEVIGRYAFYQSSIRSISLPTSVQEILGYAFGYTQLTSVEFPENVYKLYEASFERCSLLASISIPKSLVTIEQASFLDCLALRTITVATGNPKFVCENGLLIEKTGTDRELNLATNIFTELIVPEDITIMGHGCLRSLDVISVKCVGAHTIDPYVFAYAMKLQSITFGPFLKAGKLSLLAFEGCSGLSKIYIEGNNPNWIATDGIMYSVDKNNGASLYFIPAGNEMTSFTIPDEMKSLDVSAFAAVTVQEFLLEGGKTSNDYFSVHRGVVYDKGFTKIIACPQHLDTKTVPWPDVTTIRTVGTRAFYGQKNVSTIHVPNGVTHIGYQAFATARSITTITFPDTLKTFSNNCMHEVRATTVRFPPLVTELPTFMCAWMTALQTVQIDGKMTKIGSSCFSNDRELRTINFPASLKRIETGAFVACAKLQTPKFQEGLEFIGDNAFASCSGITGNLTIPSSVHTVSEQAFFMCTSIETAIVSNCNTFVAYRAFYSSEKEVKTVCIATKYFTMESENTYTKKIRSQQVLRLAALILTVIDH